MEIKIEGGVAKDHAVSLCSTCRYAQIREESDGRVTVRCAFFKTIIKKNVVKCNQYIHVNHTDLYDMKQIAWVITPGREHLGFRSQDKLSHEEKEQLGNF